MQVIMVSDIFGRTTDFENLASKVSEHYKNTLLIDPYEGKEFDFKNENNAYDYFQQNVGLNKYSKTVLKIVKQIAKPSCIIGFSVGASAVWKISQDNIFYPRTRAIGFYGSQIRNLLNVNPTIEFDLYFPKKEKHFDVLELINDLTGKQSVKCFKTKYLHGFMNKRSENYNEKGLSEYLKIIKHALSTL